MTDRIVSLLPGATEWVCELGLADRLVGVSHECDFPELVKCLPKVTRSRIDTTQSSEVIDQTVREHSESRTPLFELDSHTLQELNPSLILTQTLCNVCAVSESDVRQSLRSIGDECELLDLHAMTFGDVMRDAERLTRITGSQRESRAALSRLHKRIKTIRRSSHTSSPIRVTLLEWTAPLFCAGHWTPELIQYAGGVDPIGRSGLPSREITMDDLISAAPEVVLVACCGLDRQRGSEELTKLERTEGWSELDCVQRGQVHVFDGSAWFNRPGPRLVDALECIAEVINTARG